MTRAKILFSESHGKDHERASSADPNNGREPASGAESDPDSEHAELPREIGGRKGPEPTRYGDWEKNGRCIDF